MDPVVDLSRSVKGKVVLVTGAASGMGRATAHVFAREGAHVAVTDIALDDARGGRRRDPRRGRRAPRPGRWTSPNADASPRWCRRSPSTSAAWTSLVNNAGIGGVRADRRRQLRGAVGARRADPDHRPPSASSAPPCPSCASPSSPRIVNIASTEALGATARDSPYAAAKAGVTGLTRALAVELGTRGHHRQLHLPRPDPHRHDRGDPRGRQEDLRQAPHGDAPLRRPGGGGAHDAQPLPARRLATSPA